MKPDPAAAECPANTSDASIGIVVSDWHSEITNSLLEGALSTLKQCGVEEEDIYVAHVPGAMELTFAARQMSNVVEPSAVIVLGSVTEEQNPQFGVICQSITHGITELNLHSDIPFIFGVLITHTLDEAKAMSAGSDNKGSESAEAALKMVSMMAHLVNQ